MCYEVALSPKLLTDLDFRERNGYTRTLTPVTSLTTQETCTAIVYYAEQGHDAAYVGPLTIERSAQVISAAHGPSGSNREYFNNLVAFIESQEGVVDPYLMELNEAVKSISITGAPININE